ncbi:sigma-70 family RNA polymerase sigma factor [Dorea sp. OM02-2LB]|nr:sigma-70 family RNA polymerase sigma factor [Dorea sp. OM02-2LB]
MAYNKTSEERKWNYWKEQEEKKLRELGMEEEKIQKLRQMDREDFLEERRYREHLDETMQDMDSIKEKDSELFARDVKELLDHIGDKRIYELLKETEHQTLEILLLSTWGYSGREVAKIMGMAEQTIYTKRNRLRKKLKNLSKIIYVFLTIFLYLLKCPQSLILSALRAFFFYGKPHISRSIFLYFRYQAWLKSW